MGDLIGVIADACDQLIAAPGRGIVGSDSGHHRLRYPQ
jgi:hypothetical protein